MPLLVTMAIQLNATYATDQQRLLGGPESALFTLKIHPDSMQMFGTFLSQSPKVWNTDDVLLLAPHDCRAPEKIAGSMPSFAREILQQTKFAQTCDVTKIALPEVFIRTFLDPTINAIARFPKVTQFFVLDHNLNFGTWCPTVATTKWALERSLKGEGAQCSYIAKGRLGVAKKPEETAMVIQCRPAGFIRNSFEGLGDGEPLRATDGEIVHLYFAKITLVAGTGEL
jgi:hypothetical protein